MSHDQATWVTISLIIIAAVALARFVLGYIIKR